MINEHKEENDMKKFTMIVFMILCVLSFSGCNKDKEVETQAEGTTVNEVQQENGTQETVSSDVYDSNNSVEEDLTKNYQNAPGTPVTDVGILGEFQTYIERIYYNFLFAPQSESGEITEMDMQLFAISYIYQYEYTDLRFDLDKFVLYIPDVNVTEVVKRFFDYDFVNHKYPLDSQITYEDGYYLMPARDENFGTEPVIREVLKISDFDYRIVFALGEEGASTEHYEVIVEEREGRYVLLNYRIISDVPVVTTESTTQTTQSSGETTTPAVSN